MDGIDQVYETYEQYLKEHQAVVNRLLSLEHVPRFVQLMELKAIIREMQKLIVDHQGQVNFLDLTHQKVRGEPY